MARSTNATNRYVTAKLSICTLLCIILAVTSSCARQGPKAKYYFLHDFKNDYEFSADQMNCQSWANSQVPNLRDEAYRLAQTNPSSPLAFVLIGQAASEEKTILQSNYNHCLSSRGWKNELFFTLGWVGGEVGSVTPKLAQTKGLNNLAGVFVYAIVPNGLAEQAGLNRGDVIIKYDGKVITTINQLPSIIPSSPSKNTVDIEVIRNGQVKTLHIVPAIPSDKH